MSLSESSKGAYRHRAEQLIVQFEREVGFPVAESPESFVEWFEAQQVLRHWAYSTWRLYRAAVLYYFKLNNYMDAAGELKKLKFHKEGPGPKYVRTSKQRKKSLTDKDLALILTAIDQKKKAGANGEYDELLGLWLIAGRLTGLRPCEWKTASLDIDKNTLHVKNAKTTNNRGLGETRTLTLDESSTKTVGLFLSYFQSFLERKTYKQVYNGCRYRLWKFCRKIYPRILKHPTLYSPRHQVSANLKAGGATLAEAAAVFGHRSEATIAEYYGKKFMGQPNATQITADPDAVRQVKTKPTPPAAPASSPTPTEKDE